MICDWDEASLEKANPNVRYTFEANARFKERTYLYLHSSSGNYLATDQGLLSYELQKGSFIELIKTMSVTDLLDLFTDTNRFSSSEYFGTRRYYANTQTINFVSDTYAQGGLISTEYVISRSNCYLESRKGEIAQCRSVEFAEFRSEYANYIDRAKAEIEKAESINKF